MARDSLLQDGQQVLDDDIRVVLDAEQCDRVAARGHRADLHGRARTRAREHGEEDQDAESGGELVQASVFFLVSKLAASR
jgi:hypothetical protein